MYGIHGRAADGLAPSTNLAVSDRLRTGLALLQQAYTYAQDAGIGLWNFALEVDTLYEAGMTISDIRWLVAKRFVQHALEKTVYGDVRRSFVPGDGFRFESATCLVLTRKGAMFAQGASQGPAESRQSVRWIDTGPIARTKALDFPSDSPAARGAIASPHVTVKPRWDSTQRELRVADRIVKRFRVPARNQEMILCVFEEEGWPPHIDDPLPAHAEIDARTRLHDTINRLNRSQRQPLLRFRGNGKGTGIRWELRQPEPRRGLRGYETETRGLVHRR